MMKLNETNKTSLILTGLIFFWLVFNGFSRTALPLNTYANITVEWTFYLGLVAMVILIFRYKETVFSHHTILFHTGVLVFVIGIGLIDLLKDHDHSDLMQMMLYISFFLAISYTNWQRSHIRLLGVLGSVVLLLFFWHWFNDDMPTNRYEGYFTNPNLTGVFVASLMYFPIAAFKDNSLVWKVIYILGMSAGLVVTYVSTARSAMLLLVIAGGAWVALQLSRKVFYYLFHFLVATSGFFVLVYHFLSRSSYATKLNEWSIDQFSKQFFSGRQNIWGEAIDYGMKSPFFGHKVGIVPKDFMEGTRYWHTHNQFVQQFLESGLIGLGIFLFMLYGIWKLFCKNLNAPVVQWSACFFLGIIVYQTVEISLFFNMMPMGLLHWTIIGIGVSGVLFARVKKPLK